MPTQSSAADRTAREPVALLLGSNEGNREVYLELARTHLEIPSALHVARASSVYETEPVEGPRQRWFLNQVLLIQTSLEPGLLLGHCRAVEDKMGRRRTVRKGPRTLDVDILYFGDRVVATPILTLPHPGLARRRCALVPLHELGTGWVHPQLHRGIQELLRECKDPSCVRLVLPELQD